jgi:hypothetical protein
MGDFADFQRGARLPGAFVTKIGNLSGLSRAGYDGIQKSREDILN